MCDSMAFWGGQRAELSLSCSMPLLPTAAIISCPLTACQFEREGVVLACFIVFLTLLLRRVPGPAGSPPPIANDWSLACPTAG